MKAFSLHRSERHRELAGIVLCHDVPGAFRKGHVLRSEDIPRLIDAQWSELHLIELGPDDVGQREAGELLARAFCTPDLEPAASGHRHVLRARHNGLLKVDVAALQRINTIPGIAVFTLRNDSVVSAGQVVAEAQITPLAIERSAIAKAASETGVIRNLPFPPKSAVIWARDERLIRNLSAKLEWFGCDIEVREQLQWSDGLQPVDGIHIVSGSNALDPLDPVFISLERLGAKMQRIGLPLHPGTLLWIATLGNATIIGLPSCGHGHQLTGFDLVLPKILAEGRISDDELAGLGHGGILRKVIPSVARDLGGREAPFTQTYEPVR